MNIEFGIDSSRLKGFGSMSTADPRGSKHAETREREREKGRWSGEGSVPSACNLHTLNYCGPSCQFVSKLNLNLIIVTNK